MVESGQLPLGEAHALWQGDAETIEESGLGGVWLGDSTQANLPVLCGRQDDVLGLNAFELFPMNGALIDKFASLTYAIRSRAYFTTKSLRRARSLTGAGSFDIHKHIVYLGRA